MSASEELTTPHDGSPGHRTTDIVPKLVGDNDEFVPLVVTRLGGTLPWETESTQLQCGETVVSQNGDENIRINYEAICTHTEFKTLQSMRSDASNIRLISAAYSGPVSFDQLKFDRVPDANGQIIRGEGPNEEPLYEIQLQSKEESDE